MQKNLNINENVNDNNGKNGDNCINISDISTNCIRTDNYRTDTLCVADEIKNGIDEKTTHDNDLSINIYRYKFTDDLTNEMYKFSKIHQYDHRKDFKEAWEIWLEDNDEITDSEVRRLTNLGYDGDILDKMYKSARYYFRKKSTEKKAPQKRRAYQSVQKDLLEAMDEHIKKHINEEDFKPSEGFDRFCNEKLDLLKEEVRILCKNGFTNSEEIKQKIKKTYKNRYFILISK
jgi:hypothetical protein